MGIKNFMDNIVEEAKERGYVETLFHRRREIPELSSNNYMVRQFGARVAMNTPIQGTAADIMKIAMIKLFDRIEKEKCKIDKCYNCIKTCNVIDSPYCITKALINSVKGQTEDGLIFCGSNVSRIKEIVSVKDLMRELVCKL